VELAIIVSCLVIAVVLITGVGIYLVNRLNQS